MPAEQHGTTPTGPPRKRPARLMRQIALAMELPFVLVFSVVIGGALGYFLDSWLHTSPAFLILLGLLGFVAGVREVLRRIPKEESENDGR